MPDGQGWSPPPRRRPPWWPENEAWPPVGPDGRPGWGRAHGPWRRFGCLFALLGIFAVVGFVVVLVSLVAAVAGSFGIGIAPNVALAIVIVLAGLAMLGSGRGIRRIAEPLDDLVEAARRVEAGRFDARVRVPRRGPRGLRELTRTFNTMASRLEADERRRRDLLADVGHELRTPLAVIRGNLEAIVDGVHPADEAHLAGLIEETRVMERLVEDLRTLSLAEAGTLQLHREPTDLDVLLGEVHAGYQAEAGRTGVGLELLTPDDLPILEVDPVRIREVLANLVGNAFRYTPAGGTITLTGASAPGGGVVFTVADTGAGIEPELLPHVFDRFTKGRDSRGSGLGLAIARDLVAAHGGTIDVRSVPGTGTTFEVRLPAEVPGPA
ncbi:MAG TPA: HAMP domain-containing sensor histidine kinase [Candidatus Limnocylindrales bacterium]|nr:HAMP domain-containing sensor histidine kinase [Candidatus Limnocylindrales bacterium]